MQVFVSNLRRAIEPDRARGAAATVLVTAAPGYLVHAAPGSIDAHEFVRLAEEGRAALDEDDGDRATQLLGRAGALWRGAALADVADAPFARPEVARLTELRLRCAEDRVDAELSLGHHGGVVAEVRQRVGEQPLRERSRAQLMLALYRSGRQAEALAAYREGRGVLRDELGLEPGPVLAALHQAVLRHDPELDWAPPVPAIQDLPRAAEPVDEPGSVLVVDDSAVNRRLLVAALTGLGHEARTAVNGRRALELLRADDGAARIDVVLLDLLMPVLDGYSTLAAIRADPALRHLPVIMVSAVDELESVVRCIDLGATDYLPKPLRATMLAARLRSALSAKRLRDSEREGLRRVEAMIAGGPADLREAGPRPEDGVADRLARRLRQLAGDVATRESELRAEIAALRAEIDLRSEAPERAHG